MLVLEAIKGKCKFVPVWSEVNALMNRSSQPARMQRLEMPTNFSLNEFEDIEAEAE